MSAEAAAAILTQIYFDKVTGPSTNLTPETPGSSAAALDCVDRIGSVYGTFWNRFHAFPDLAKRSGPNPSGD